jgi:hypothetical protein
LFKHQNNYFPITSWWEQVTFKWYDDVCFVLIAFILQCLKKQQKNKHHCNRFLMVSPLPRPFEGLLVGLSRSLDFLFFGLLLFFLGLFLIFFIVTGVQASTLTYFSTCPFGQLTKKSICPTQSFSCPKKLIKITKTRE